MKIQNATKTGIMVALFLGACFITSAGASETPEADVKYTGVYNGRQIIPNYMAIFCKTNAEDMIKERKKLYDCMDKVVLKMNDKNASVRAEGVSDFANMRYEALKYMMGQAVTTGATISNYMDVQETMGETVAQTKTEHEDFAAMATATSMGTDVQNDARGLYSIVLQYSALEGLGYVDSNAVLELQQKIEENDAKQQANEKEVPPPVVSTSTVTVETKNPGTTDWAWDEGNMCSRRVCKPRGSESEQGDCSDESAVCPDGTYLTNDENIVMSCTGGVCVSYNYNSEYPVSYSDDNPYYSEWSWKDGNMCERQKCTGSTTAISSTYVDESKLTCTTEEDVCPDNYGVTAVYDKSNGKSFNVTCNGGVCTKTYYDNEDKPEDVE